MIRWEVFAALEDRVIAGYRVGKGATGGRKPTPRHFPVTRMLSSGDVCAVRDKPGHLVRVEAVRSPGRSGCCLELESAAP